MSIPVIKKAFRGLGIIKLSDDIRFQVMKLKNSKSNAAFKKEFPEVPIPPCYMLYEAHKIDYRSYLENGLINAENLKTQFEKYINLENKKVLDWGCGPARVLRHFTKLLPETKFYGTDYNENTILWNKEHIKDVSFFVNNITPPTFFQSNSFDAIYGLSIFTHLSEANHKKWIDELYRISNNNAILILTTHGEAFKIKLLEKEQKDFENNKLIVHGKTKEGHRTFVAFHPPKLMKSLFGEKFQVLEHIPGKQESYGISQDKWVLKKRIT